MGRCANTLLLLATALLLAGCGATHPEWKAQDLSLEQVQAARITLHEGSCAWGCWSREVTVTGAGQLTSLNGSKVVRSAHFSENDVRDLLGGFYRAQQEMPCEPEMVKDKNGDMQLEQSIGDCKSYARFANFEPIGNDLPGETIEVAINGETFYYSGSIFGPDELTDFAKRLRGLE